jgi:hypothetical protein
MPIEKGTVGHEGSGAKMKGRTTVPQTADIRPLAQAGKR